MGGQWYAFDARNNVPRIGRVLMARGRDAADVAMTTTFGVNQLQSFKVWTDEVGPEALHWKWHAQAVLRAGEWLACVERRPHLRSWQHNRPQFNRLGS